MNDLGTSELIRAKSVPRKRRSPQINQAKATRVYVIAASDYEGPCKVGISSHPKRRVTQLQVSTPSKLKLYFECRPKEQRAVDVETEVHRLLEHWHARGEWINCVPALAQKVIEAVVDKDASISEFLAVLKTSDAAWIAFQGTRENAPNRFETPESKAAMVHYRAIQDQLFANWPKFMKAVDPWTSAVVDNPFTACSKARTAAI